VSEFSQAGPLAAEHHGGRALGAGDTGKHLGRGSSRDLGMSSAEIGGQLPVPVQVNGWPARQAVVDLDVDHQQLRILGSRQLSGTADDLLAPSRVGIPGQHDRRCRR
jgi:hypothetical protein